MNTRVDGRLAQLKTTLKEVTQALHPGRMEGSSLADAGQEEGAAQPPQG